MIAGATMLFVSCTRGVHEAPIHGGYFDSGYRSILFAGDILIANNALNYIRKNGHEYPFAKIKNDITEYDYFVANLETPITSRGIEYTNKLFRFRLNDQQVQALKCLDLSAVTLANNHIMDYGHEGMRDTLAFLEKNGIAYAGAGKDIAAAREPLKIRLGRHECFILAYCERPPESFFAGPNSHGSARFIIDDVKTDIAKYKNNRTIVIVSLHWGQERREAPRRDQIESARAIIGAGADMIVGHHPHWAQGIEIYKGKPIIYSLGDFYSGFWNESDRDNIMAAVYFSAGTLKRLEIIPLAGRTGYIGYQPFVLKGRMADDLLKHILRLSKNLGTEFEIIDGRGVVNF